MKVVVCLSRVAGRVLVDPITGVLDADPRSFGPPLSDQAALEVALSIEAADVVVALVGPNEAGDVLRDALAVGASHAIHVVADDLTSQSVAASLVPICADADLVLCGDGGANGSGAVPGFLSALLGRPQLLGALKIVVTTSTVTAHRKMDRGRVAVFAAGLPAIVSVDGSAATLRRASLPGVMAATTAVIEVAAPKPATTSLKVSDPRPLRQRTKVTLPPSGDSARERVLSITKATEASDPPRTLRLDPAAAAAEAVATLRQWGYL